MPLARKALAGSEVAVWRDEADDPAIRAALLRHVEADSVPDLGISLTGLAVGLVTSAYPPPRSDLNHPRCAR